MLFTNDEPGKGFAGLQRSFTATMMGLWRHRGILTNLSTEAARAFLALGKLFTHCALQGRTAFLARAGWN